MMYKYLPDRIETQYKLFKPQIIIIQLACKKEKISSVISTLINFKNKLSSEIRIILLPTSDFDDNNLLGQNEKIHSFIKIDEFNLLIKKIKESFSKNEHQLIYEYLNVVI